MLLLFLWSCPHLVAISGDMLLFVAYEVSLVSSAAGKHKAKKDIKRDNELFRLLKGSMGPFDLNKGNILPEKKPPHPQI